MAKPDPWVRFQGRATDLLMVVVATAAFTLARLLTGNFWLACAAGALVLGFLLVSVYAIGDRQE